MKISHKLALLLTAYGLFRSTVERADLSPPIFRVASADSTLATLSTQDQFAQLVLTTTAIRFSLTQSAAQAVEASTLAGLTAQKMDSASLRGVQAGMSGVNYAVPMEFLLTSVKEINCESDRVNVVFRRHLADGEGMVQSKDLTMKPVLATECASFVAAYYSLVQKRTSAVRSGTSQP